MNTTGAQSEWVDRAVQAWATLSSPAGLATAGILLGLLLLFAGGKLVRVGLGVAGIGVGGALGWLLAQKLFPAGIQSGPGLGVTAVGAFTGLMIGLSAYRLAICAASGVVVAALGLAAALTAASIDAPSSVRGAREAAATRLIDARSHVADAWASRTASDPAAPSTAAWSAASVGRQEAGAVVDAAWTNLSDAHRLWILAGTVCGALVGMGVGAIFPRRASAISTAAVGAAACVAGAWHFALAAGVPAVSPVWLVGAGCALTLLGAGAQNAMSKPMKPIKPSAQPAPAA